MKKVVWFISSFTLIALTILSTDGCIPGGEKNSDFRAYRYKKGDLVYVYIFTNNSMAQVFKPSIIITDEVLKNVVPSGDSECNIALSYITTAANENGISGFSQNGEHFRFNVENQSLERLSEPAAEGEQTEDSLKIYRALNAAVFVISDQDKAYLVSPEKTFSCTMELDYFGDADLEGGKIIFNDFGKTLEFDLNERTLRTQSPTN